MSVPIMISMLVQALYNVVDTFFVARYAGDVGTSALGLAFPVQNLMIAVAVGTGVGVNALLSRSLGEKNQVKADKIAVIKDGVCVEYGTWQELVDQKGEFYRFRSLQT